MRVASRVSSARSWVTNSTPPRNSCSCSSSHWITSMSRWLVGSSSSSRSGSQTSARASATRRFQPPESEASVASAGSSSRSRMWSTRWPRLQPPRPRSRAGAPPCGAAELSSLPTACETWWYSASRRPASARPSATASYTVVFSFSGRSCASRATRRPGCRQISPASGSASPSTSFSSVDLPAPLRPIRQTRSPASI